MREIISNSFREDLMEERVMFESWNIVHDYLKINMSHLNVEHFRMLILGSKNELITDCLIAQGTVNHANVYIREIVKLALDNFAISVILAHNHPSGDPTPSQSDIEITKSIMVALNTISVRVQDHIVVGKKSVYSFLQNGLLK
jgi:DNA repair protein RadC